MFGNLLVHTPIWQLAVVRIVHFSAGTESGQHRIGRTLAPTGPWGLWGNQIEHASKRSGMSVLTMELDGEDPPFGRAVTATVQPSQKVRPGIGVHMEVNHRYTLPTLEKTIGSQEIVSKLSSVFETSLKQSEAIIDQIMSLKELVQ
jgi:hypothetical protein